MGLAVVLAAAGAFLGRPDDLVDPITPMESLPAWNYAVLAVGLLAIGGLDPALRGMLASSGSRRSIRREGAWAALWMVVLLAAVGLGMLLIFGGVLVAPSLAFFTVPANLGPAMPVVMAIAAFWFAFAVASLLAGAPSVVAGDGPNGIAVDGPNGIAGDEPNGIPSVGANGPSGRAVVLVVGLALAALVIAVLPTTAAGVLAATAAVAVVALVVAWLLAARTTARGPGSR
jgi:lysylphosphatidylglycerol synthetase-like protein (DUF2156 family)